jgi:hypothetical protein
MSFPKGQILQMLVLPPALGKGAVSGWLLHTGCLSVSALKFGYVKNFRLKQSL